MKWRQLNHAWACLTCEALCAPCSTLVHQAAFCCLLRLHDGMCTLQEDSGHTATTNSVAGKEVPHRAHANAVAGRPQEAVLLQYSSTTVVQQVPRMVFTHDF